MSSVSVRLMTATLAVLWLVCVGLFQVQGQAQDEASLVCHQTFAKFTPNHTACLGPSATCRIIEGGVSKRDQKLIVDVHNYYRNLIASGNETQLGFPSAANMLKMEWDPELAYVAQMHANQCQFAHDCYECRKTDHHSTVGQNLYIYQTSQSSVDTQWQFVVKEWYDEIKIAPPVVAQSFDLFNLNIGHFTQIAWASTNRVGCGIVTYEPQEEGENSIFKTAQLYTCNYAPGGNFLGEKMDEDGHSATQCPVRYSRSKRFTSLCEFTRAKINKNVPAKKKKKVNKKVKQTSPTLLSNTIQTESAFHFHQQPPPSQQDNFVVPSSALLPSSSFVPSSSVLPSNTRTTSTTTRRVVTTNRTTRKPTTRLVVTKPGQTVTQTSKRVTNWWDKWSINFANQFSNPKSNKSTTTSTTRAPSWKSWTWTWTAPSRKPITTFITSNNYNYNNNQQQQSPSSGRFLRMEMSQNGTTTHRINQPI